MHSHFTELAGTWWGDGCRAGLGPGRLTLGALVFQRRAPGAGTARSVQGTGQRLLTPSPGHRGYSVPGAYPGGYRAVSERFTVNDFHLRRNDGMGAAKNSCRTLTANILK